MERGTRQWNASLENKFDLVQMPIVVTVYPLLRDWTYQSTICKSKCFRVPWIVTLYGEALK